MDSKPSNYQVIARKYRPQTFANVVGQEAIVTTLKNALRFNRLAHAYLFCGCRGTGKTTLARVFAKALNCSQLSAECEPCNACSSCLDIIAGRSLDVLEIDGASNRGIDDIRQIKETIGYAPASGKYKIYIIDEVHMLTKEAFNALLKTLEEPPANAKFFFATTEPHKVLPTIISRCQRFDLNRIPFEDLKNKLAWIARDLNVECEDDVLSLIANLSEGSLRDAESLFDQIICYAEHPITAAKVLATLGIMPRSAFFALDRAFEEQNLSFAFELAGDIFSSGKDLSYFIDNLIEHYRSLLKLKLGSFHVFSTARLKEQYQASAILYTEEQCLYILDFLIQWQQQISKTPFKRVSLEMILLHILRSKHRIALPTLVKRLIELEQQIQSNPSRETVDKSPEENLKPLSVETTVEKELPPREKSPSLQQDTIDKSSMEPSKESSKFLSAGVISEKMETELSPRDESPSFEQKISVPQDTTSKALSVEEALLKKIKEKIEEPSHLVEEPQTEIQSEPSSSLILSKSQWESAASSKQTQTSVTSSPIPETEKPASPKADMDSTSAVSAGISLSRYDTLVRFAAVELEGIIKKEQT